MKNDTFILGQNLKPYSRKLPNGDSRGEFKIQQRNSVPQHYEVINSYFSFVSNPNLYNGPNQSLEYNAVLRSWSRYELSIFGKSLLKWNSIRDKTGAPMSFQNTQGVPLQMQVKAINSSTYCIEFITSWVLYLHVHPRAQHIELGWSSLRW